MHRGPRARASFPKSYRGFCLVRKHGRVYAIPPTAQVERILGTAGMLDRHPAVVSAATLGEVQRLVDGTAGGPEVTRRIGRVEGHDIVVHRGAVYAVPRHAGDVDLDPPEDRRRAGVISGTTPEQLEGEARRLAAGEAVEFAGWLPVHSTSGNCGAHPQFQHTDTPPTGYRFTRSAPPSAYGAPGRVDRFRPRAGAIGSKLYEVARTAVFAARVPFTFVLPRRGVTLGSRVRVFVAFVRLLASLLLRGCRPLAVLSFLQTRHLTSQLLLGKQELVFLTSTPYTYGQNPWVIESEDPTTLFHPLVQNGRTCGLDLSASPYLPS